LERSGEDSELLLLPEALFMRFFQASRLARFLRFSFDAEESASSLEERLCILLACLFVSVAFVFNIASVGGEAPGFKKASHNSACCVSFLIVVWLPW
jgi:hypothetical protein